MFTIFIWDADSYQPIEKIPNLLGNEEFLVPSDLKKYPLLGNLASCEEDTFSNELLVELACEVKKLMAEFERDELIKQYLLIFFNLINKAIELNKSILITPFVE